VLLRLAAAAEARVEASLSCCPDGEVSLMSSAPIAQNWHCQTTGNINDIAQHLEDRHKSTTAAVSI